MENGTNLPAENNSENQIQKKVILKGLTLPCKRFAKISR